MNSLSRFRTTTPWRSAGPSSRRSSWSSWPCSPLWRTSPSRTEANTYEVEVERDSTSWEPKIVVVGQQWWWEFRYYFTEDVDADFLDDRNLPPADIVTAGRMVIPTGQEVELLVTSRDVIHSFWIPALNGKRDARPGFFAQAGDLRR